MLVFIDQTTQFEQQCIYYKKEPQNTIMKTLLQKYKLLL